VSYYSLTKLISISPTKFNGFVGLDCGRSKQALTVRLSFHVNNLVCSNLSNNTSQEYHKLIRRKTLAAIKGIIVTHASAISVLPTAVRMNDPSVSPIAKIKIAAIIKRVNRFARLKIPNCLLTHFIITIASRLLSRASGPAAEVIGNVFSGGVSCVVRASKFELRPGIRSNRLLYPIFSPVHQKYESIGFKCFRISMVRYRIH
jgi:hypothetical protein